MKNPVSPGNLARISANRPWRVLAVWFVLLVLAGFASTGLGDAFTTESDFTNNPESVQADTLLETRFHTGEQEHPSETVIVRTTDMTVDDPAFTQHVGQLAADLRAMPEVITSVFTYYDAVAAGDPTGAGLVSADRQTTLLSVTFAGDFDAASHHTADYLTVIEAHAVTGFEVLTVGDLSVDEAFNRLAEEDLIKGEGLGLLAALVVLIIVFGALIAAGIPIVLALASIFVAVGLTALLGRVMDLSFFIVNMITLIGLAVGIDYALFVVERYREERRHGRTRHDAIEVAGGTASKAVLFSGITVVLALMGMLLIPTVLFHSLGAGAILVVIVAVVATLTLVPALLGLLGDRIDWPRRPKYDTATVIAQNRYDHETIHRGFWGRVTHIVMARPVVSVVLSVSLLIAATLPYLDLNRGQSGPESLPPSDIRTAYEVLSNDFAAGRLAPVQVVIDGARNEATEADIAQLVAAIDTNDVFGAAESVEWNTANDLALLRIPLTVDGSSPAALAAVGLLRDELIPAAFAGTPARVLVTGGPAFNADFEAVVRDYTPLVFAFVLGLSFVLLVLAFRSIVVPAKAIVMNLLSVGSAYGLMVLVFQKGVGNEFFGFQQTPVIEAWVPIFLFCVLFGLSMDYHVFLLSRIREHYDASGNNTESVAVGLQATGKIITGAALIMMAVFAGFASGQLVMFQQMGFGLAVAVLIDATVIRSVLVPASMTLLGNWNWYLPQWLHWLPDLRVEGAPVPIALPVPEAIVPDAGIAD
jgi:putative drug exporter of the RND superfamily